MYLRFRIFGNSTAYFSTSTTQIFESGQVFDIGMVYSNNNPPLVPIEWMGLLGYIESVTYFN
ncbi:MAG: hypothetical protein IPG90_19055 [Bacteroidetes bacterium]|nr:hypothetical protein [Bacteroidota bacterium]